MMAYAQASLWRYLSLRLLGAVPLLLGVTFLSFLLTAYFGPDPVYALAGRNPSPTELDELRFELGQDRPIVMQYADFLHRLATFDLGHSYLSGESVTELLGRAVPVSLALLAPGFVLGLAVALSLGLSAAWFRGCWLDRAIGWLSALGMSLSLVIVVIVFQILFSIWLGWFPARGWSIDGPASYLRYATLPTLIMIFANLGYNVRFFRAVFVHYMDDPPVRTARAFGLPARTILRHYLLRAAAPPILTRVVFSIPLILISGSLIIESHFGIPGIGKVAFDAIVGKDQPVLMALVSMSAIAVTLALTLVDLVARLFDPRGLADSG